MSVSPLVIVVGSVGLVVGMGVGFVAAWPSAAVTSSTQPSTSPAVQTASPPPCGEALGFPTDSDATGALRRMESRMGGSQHGLRLDAVPRDALRANRWAADADGGFHAHALRRAGPHESNAEEH